MDSVTTISSNASAQSPRRDRTKSPARGGGRDRSPSYEREQGSMLDDNLDRDRSHSPAPRRYDRSMSRDSRSPPPLPKERLYRARDEDERTPRSRRRFSSGSEMSRDSRPRTRDLSRSPHANTRRPGKGRREPARGDRPRDRAPPHRGPQAEDNRRERSLSPFSKRLALTRSMGPG
jgi:hypothetical protein